MGKQYQTLKTLSFPLNSEPASPPTLPEIIHLDDSALHVFVNFQFHRPGIIQAKQSLEDALHEMKASNMHMLLVVDTDKHIVGLLSSQALHGEKPFKLIQEDHSKLSEISVAQLMMPIDQILCMDYDALKMAKIGDLIETFKQYRRHYALVIKKDHHEKQWIQGYFSASRIGRTLSLNTTTDDLSLSTIHELHSMLREFE